MSIIVTKSGQKARRIEPGEIPQETYLQEYIVTNPEALPLSDLRDDLTFLIVAREFPTESGPIDAMGTTKVISMSSRPSFIATLTRDESSPRCSTTVPHFGNTTAIRGPFAPSLRNRLA